MSPVDLDQLKKHLLPLADKRVLELEAEVVELQKRSSKENVEKDSEIENAKRKIAELNDLQQALKQSNSELQRQLASRTASERILQKAIALEFRYALTGLSFGFASVLSGATLGIHGLMGKTSWSTDFLGLKSNLNDATPGVVLFLIGLFIVVFTRPKIKLGNLSG